MSNREQLAADISSSSLPYQVGPYCISVYRPGLFRIRAIGRYLDRPITNLPYTTHPGTHPATLATYRATGWRDTTGRRRQRPTFCITVTLFGRPVVEIHLSRMDC